MARIEGKYPTKALWIFCEGEKTEKNYFSKLRAQERIRRITIKVVNSDNTDAKGVVEHAIAFMKKGRDFEESDIVYCVFDRDRNTNVQLEQAKKLAKDNGIVIIFSNPCFEYWILCHLGYYPASYEPEEVVQKIKEKMQGYTKKDPAIYDKTKDNIQLASANAKRIKDECIRKGIELISRESNPLSLVFELIAKINEFKD